MTDDRDGLKREAALAAVAMVQDDTPSLAPLQRGLESVYACLAAKTSAATSKFVSVRRVGGG